MAKEQKKMYSYRVPESIFEDIDRMVKLKVNEYERGLLLGSVVEEELYPTDNVFKIPEKKSNPTDEAIDIPEVEKVNMDFLKDIALGKGLKGTYQLTKKKFVIEDEYDCIEVTSGLPSIIDRIYYGTRDKIAFWDKDDISVYYVKWDGKYYKFVDSSEFNRFAKDKNIK